MNATISQWLSGPISQDIALALAHSLWQGAGVALALAAALRAIPQRFAGVRYWTSCGALVAIVIASAATFGVLRAEHSVGAGTRSKHPVAVQEPRSMPVAEVVVAPENASPALSLPFGYIVAVWMLGVGFFSVWHVCGWAWLVRI